MGKYKSIVQPHQLECAICGKGMFPELYDTHHIFNGAYKRKSENDGMLLFVHRCCHRQIHDNAYVQNQVKRYAERIWLENYGTKEDFIKRYGKDYLWDEEEN